MRSVFLIYCLILSLNVFGLPLIEVAQLAELDVAKLYNIDKKNQANNPLFDSIMKNQLEKQLPKVSSLIRYKLQNSGLYTVIDADSTIKMWKMQSSGILETLYQAPVISRTESSIESQKISTPGSVQKKSQRLEQRYVLLSWVENINSGEDKKKIFNSNKVSFISNLEISIKYKLVDSLKKEVVVEFIAVGHYGMARILPDVNQKIDFSVEKIVSGAMNSLTTDVLRSINAQLSNSTVK